MKEDLSYLWSKLIALLGSRKFWVLLFAALASLGLPIGAELQALIILVAGVVFAGLTAYEDKAKLENKPGQDFWGVITRDAENPEKDKPEA